MHFIDDLTAAIKDKKSRVVVGLDTDPRKLPVCLTKDLLAPTAQMRFNRAVLDAIAPIVPAVKIQSAYYELLGPDGATNYVATIEAARDRGLFVIGDVKRGDIAATAEAYAEAHLGAEQGYPTADAITINPLFGADGIWPFVDLARPIGKGLFILVRTSNPSAKELQDVTVGQSAAYPDGRPWYMKMAELVKEHHDYGLSGYSLVGAVVGATCPEEARQLRAYLDHNFFLVPGYGAQGATAQDVAACFDKDGYGAIVNASRSIIYAYEKHVQPDNHDCQEVMAAVREHAAAAAKKMTQEINEALANR